MARPLVRNPSTVFRGETSGRCKRLGCGARLPLFQSALSSSNSGRSAPFSLAPDLSVALGDMGVSAQSKMWTLSLFRSGRTDSPHPRDVVVDILQWQWKSLHKSDAQVIIREFHRWYRIALISPVAG
jgi:hypothetical protein